MSEPMQATPAALGLRRDLRHLMIATVVLYTILVVFIALIGWYGIHTANQTHRQNKALCAYRNDLAARVASNSVFLAHPTSFGLSDSAVQILRNTDVNQRNTIHALSGLGCG